MFAGRFASSRSHLEEALALYDPISHRSLVHQTGIPPPGSITGVFGDCPFLSRLSGPGIGTEQRGNRRGSEAGSSAVFGWRAWHSAPGCFRSSETTQPWVSGQTQLIAVATEQGFPYWRALGTIYRGWVKVKNGDVAEGISLLRSGSTAYRATGAEVWMPHHIALLARACEIAGQIEEGLTLLDDALQIVERTGERWFAAELNRHKGQLLLRQGHSEAAEELYRKALSIAEEQEAKLWELRAAVEPRPAPPRPGPPRRSPRPSRAGLRLVHRRLRHARSQRGEGTARRTRLYQASSLTCTGVR